LNRRKIEDSAEDHRILKQAIEKFDNAVFDGTSALKVYRSFDRDQDGFVSHNDMRNKIVSRNILSKKETDLLINYADSQNKGYLEFSDFVKILRPNMTNLKQNGT